MVIVDDHLTLLVLAGAVSGRDFADDVVTTSLWYLHLLAAETIAAAVHFGASIVVAAPNRGGPIELAARELGVSYEVRVS